MEKSIFRVEKMDCPSEERMIKMKLEPMAAIQSLNIDIPKRTVEVVHTGETNMILSELESLRLNTKLVSSENVEEYISSVHTSENKLLWTVLLINLAFFAIEIISGILARSMGLVADSLDMLADSVIYGLSLLAVGAALARKKQVALFAGYFQIILAMVGLVEVIRRFIGAKEVPDFLMMINISILALIANAVSLYLLQKGKSKETHIKASMICTSNDVIVNAGVILAGGLVYLLQSSIPDLIIGAIVFFIVARGAYRILQLAR